MRQTALGLIALLVAGSLTLAPPSDAQPAGRTWLIGILVAQSRSGAAYRIEAFRKGMLELGYSQGKNLALEYRSAEGQLDRLPALAAEVVGLKVDVILALGLPAARAAKQATSTIPIVFTGGDPVRTGLVASLARPGGNVTGLADPTVDVSTKRLELLKEAVPWVSRVAMLWNPANPTNPLQVKDTQATAPSLGITVSPVEVKSIRDLDRALAAVKTDGAGALLVPGDPMFVSQAHRIRDAAAKNRLPVMYPTPEAVAAGGLMAYGTSLADLAHRAAYFVDKILKGAKPADLPVEQPTKFEFVINLRTAKDLGLTIPPSVLLRADRVIQ
jgi:putative ABC transport system substrate-binding protein